MKLCSRIWIILALFANGTFLTPALTPEQVAQLPPAAAHPVRFSDEIRPILEAACTKCHGRGKSNGGFRIDSRETFLQGGESGPAIVAGKSAESLLIELVAGFDPEAVMPQKGTKLTATQIGLLRAWIDQGAKWDAGVSFAKLPPVNLKPARPVLPVGAEAFASRNAIDMILDGYFVEHGVRPGPSVSDRLFARRVYLDVIGLLPTPEELKRFLEDPHPDKRTRLARRLLADNPRYAEHWLTFWNDLLRNDYKGTGYIDGGRKQITAWLYESLARNKPYDRFVAELINPSPESEGFTKGITWRGTVNASQLPPLQAAQNISQVFMGVNLKCASCHDSFINDWTLADAYGLAGIYADSPLELVHCDKPTGRTAETRFIYPELGGINSAAAKPERLKRLAEIITAEPNARLTRTIVNRLWAKFMGVGLVPDLDDMEQPAWQPELLDWLAADLTANGHDLKKTIERILTSQAYQAPSVSAPEQLKGYVFRGPNVRRLSAEQYLDALAAITDTWEPTPLAQADFYAGRPGEMPRAAWIWNAADAAESAPPGTVYFRKEFTLPKPPVMAQIWIACDNGFRLSVNGKEIGSGRDYTKPGMISLQPHLVAGLNVVAVAAVNDAASGATPANPAGLLCYARIRIAPGADERELNNDFVSDASWQWTTNRIEGWEQIGFVTVGWSRAVMLGAPGMAPWQTEQRFVQGASSMELQGRTRAALVAADPLMVALGRPNREQVMTTRASTATTLQALELTNGQTLAERLKKGSEKLLAGGSRQAGELVSAIYLHALGRPPTDPERQMAESLVGSPVRRESVEDLLWAVVMLPEFQLIF